MIGAALLALLGHGVFGVVLLVSGVLQPLSSGRLPALGMSEELTTPAPLEIESLTQQLDRTDERTPEEQKRKKEEEAPKADGQVVDIAKPALEQRPEEARFLAEYDAKVQRETKGPRGKTEAGAQAPSVPLPPQPAQPRTQQAQRTSPPGPPAPKQPGQVAEPLAGLQELSPDGTSPHRSPSEGEQQRRTGGGGPLRSRPNLLATPEVLQRALGQGAGSVDYLKDLDDGESTALSAKKWKFASFFNRLKRSVSDEWHPDTVYVRHDPSGNIYGVKDRVTVLRVSLKPDGRIAGVQVMRPSGVEFLDDEAAGAFKRAQPFPNPPQQLVEADGQIHFNFAFIFELSGKTSFKVFKY